MIHCKNVSVELSGKEILHSVSLEVLNSQKIVIQSASGTGKSTLLKSIFGIIPIKRGSIEINSIPLNRSNLSLYRKLLFYMPQDLQFPNLTVSEYFFKLSELQANKHIDFSQSKILSCLQKVDLQSHILEQNTESLSGGEKQRVALATGLILDKKIWLLDEPVAALDTDLKYKIADVLYSVDATMLLVSHDNVWDRYSIINF